MNLIRVMPAQGTVPTPLIALSLPRRHPHWRDRIVLKVADLCKTFGETTVFERFGFQLRENGFTALVGPSGCGKSTLFNVLTGVAEKDGGEISWMDAPVSHLGAASAYMQQKDLLLPWFSLMENALLPAGTAGGDPAASRRKAAALFKRLDLEGFEKYSPDAISVGMRQRCALARTLMFDRDLVLLDEPLSALDAITRRSMQSLLLMLQVEFRKSILMITHDIEEAVILADDIMVLSGRPMRILETFSPGGPKPRRVSDRRLIDIKEYVLDLLQRELDR